MTPCKVVVVAPATSIVDRPAILKAWPLARVVVVVSASVPPFEMITSLVASPRLAVVATDRVPALMLILPMKSLAAASTSVPAPVLLSAVVTPPEVRPVPPMVLP